MSPQPILREWARILLACDAEGSINYAQCDPATVPVWERLRGQFSRLMGASAFHALASRALTLAKSISPALIPVRIAADGSLQGLSEVESKTDSNPDNAMGVILIAQLLGLFLGLLGEATMLQLIEHLRPQFEVTAEWRATGAGSAVSGADRETNEALKDLLGEIDRLRSVGDRLETMADKHANMESGLVSVAGNIRNIAAVLDIFTLIRGKSEAPGEDTSEPPSTGYVM